MLANNSQHCWMLHVTLSPAAFALLVTCSCVFFACCSCLLLLRVVGSYCAKFETGQIFDPTTPNISFFFPYMIAEAGCFLELRKPLLIHFCVEMWVLFSIFSIFCITSVILPHRKFLQFDWLRAVIFQLNLKYLHVKITNRLRVVV